MNNSILADFLLMFGFIFVGFVCGIKARDAVTPKPRVDVSTLSDGVVLVSTNMDPDEIILNIEAPYTLVWPNDRCLDD